MTKQRGQTLSESRSAPQDERCEASLLSPRRAFVVQFRMEADGAPGHFTGRVEHMVSGHAAHFHSPEELLEFFTTILSKVHN